MASGVRRVAAQVRRLRQRKVWELGGLFSPWLELPESFGSPKRRRLFPPWRTFWLFLTQVLSADKACREVVRGFLAWLAFEGGGTASPKTAAYCKARRRLRLPDLQGVHGQVCRAVQAMPAAEGLWLGRPVKVADGSALSMPDTAANQLVYPQSPRAKPGCGFPLMRIVGIFSLATGTLLDLAKGTLRVAERTLFRQLWHLLERGDVLLADCGFCSYADFYCLAQLGVDCVMGNHPRRSVGLTVLRVFHKGDRLLAWHKTGSCPEWLSRADWDAMPDRPNRSEPRARKRRPKNYQLLNKPRRLFKEIQHRNRYRKALS